MTPRRADEASAPLPFEAARRLDVLRRLYVPETDADARARLARERPPARTPFEVAVAGRLRELRALCALSNYLHQARPSRRRPASP